MAASAPAAAPAAAEPPAMTISVSDPQKQGEGMSAFISYKVTAVLSRKLDDMDAMSYTVVRRFSDFVWLRASLRESHPHLLVPALPEKQALGRLNADFVDIRHRALQRFVARLSSHPELSAAPSVRRFVSLQGEAFAAMRDAKRSAGAMVSSAAATAGSSISRFMKSAAGAVSSAVARARGGSDAAPPPGAVPVAGGPAATAAAGGVVPPASGGASAEDLSFGELSAYAENQGPILAALYNSAAAGAAQHRARAQALLEYGASLRALGGSDGGPLGGGLSSAGLALWTASTAAYELAVQASELLVERLADAVRGVRAVKELMTERSRASAALADSLAAVESLRARLTALAASSAAGAGAERAKLENELGGAQAAVTAARARYDTVAASVIAEMERYRGMSKGDFRAMLVDFASARARAAGKVAAAWEGLQPALALMVAQEGGAPLAPGAAGAAGGPAAAAASAAPAVGGAGAAAGISAF